MSILTNILNLLIFLAGLIALIRWKQIDKIFYPFIFMIWLGCVNEVLSIVLASQGHHTIINNNIYILTEALLILWFFKSMGLFDGQKTLLTALITFYCCLWLVESLAIRRFTQMNSFFFIFYAFGTVLMSISTINYLLVVHKTSLLKNATFLICIGFLVYFTQSVLINSFWLYGLTKSKTFLLSIHRIMIFVNLFANFLYAAALLWIPRKQPSLLLY